MRFGMSGAEVIAYLGMPDKFEGRDDSGLNYRSSRGFGLLVHPRLGVQFITCWSKASVPPFWRVADFAGVTPEGIGMGASRAQIIKAYGKPSREESKGRQADLSYNKLGIAFTLLNDRVVHIAVSKPR